MRRILPFLFLLLFPTLALRARAAFASSGPPPVDGLSCPSVRLDQGSGPMANVAVRDQGSVGDCFAQVAAQMVDAWRFSHGDTNDAFQTSGLNLAFDYWASQANSDAFSQPGDPNDGQGGDVQTALALAAKTGVCDKAHTLEALSQDDIKSLFEDLQSTLSKEDKQVGSKNPTPVDKDKTIRNFDNYIAKFDKDFDEKNSCIQETDGAPVMPEITELVSALREPGSDGEIASLLGQACSGKSRMNVAIPGAPEYVAFNQNEDTITANLRSWLSEPNPQPVSAGICDQVLYKSESYRGRNPKKAGLSSDCMSKAHAVLIIGARAQGKTCQYLVRSSWGPSCEGFGAGWSCDAQEGAAWVDEDALVGNMEDYGQLQGPGNMPTGGPGAIEDAPR